MQWAHSLPSTDTVPTTQAFRCDACKETLNWKGEAPSTQTSLWITRYVAMSFRRVDGDFVLGRPSNALMPTSLSRGPS